jgi:hypothetical protein
MKLDDFRLRLYRAIATVVAFDYRPAPDSRHSVDGPPPLKKVPLCCHCFGSNHAAEQLHNHGEMVAAEKVMVEKVAADQAKTKRNEGRRRELELLPVHSMLAIRTYSIVHGEFGRLGEEANQAEKGNRDAYGKPNPHGGDHILVSPYDLHSSATSLASVPHALLFNPENRKHQPGDTRTTTESPRLQCTIFSMPAALPPAPSCHCTPIKELSKTIVVPYCPNEYR